MKLSIFRSVELLFVFLYISESAVGKIKKIKTSSLKIVADKESLRFEFFNKIKNRKNSVKERPVSNVNVKDFKSN